MDIIELIEIGDIDNLKKKLINNFDINITFPSSPFMTPLLWAIFKKQTQIAFYLLQNGADYLKCDVFGKNALHYACQQGNLELVKWLLNQDDIDINVGTEENNTPLMFACWRGHKEIVQYLIEKGADIQKVNHHSENALFFAVEYGLLEIVQFLVEHGVNINQKNLKAETPLKISELECWKNITHFLKENGAITS